VSIPLNIPQPRQKDAPHPFSPTSSSSSSSTHKLDQCLPSERGKPNHNHLVRPDKFPPRQRSKTIALRLFHGGTTRFNTHLSDDSELLNSQLCPPLPKKNTFPPRIRRKLLGILFMSDLTRGVGLKGNRGKSTIR
jgi:hypothetical protein